MTDCCRDRLELLVSLLEQWAIDGKLQATADDWIDVAWIVVPERAAAMEATEAAKRAPRRLSLVETRS